jgi:HEAT repeat protein
MVAALVAVGMTGLSAAHAQVAHAQEGRADDERVRDRKRKLEQEGGTEGEQAAADLFMTPRLVDLGPEGSHDAYLLGVIQNRDASRRESRLRILVMLRQFGRFRVEPGCRLAQEALDDPVTQLSQQAVATFPAMQEEKGVVYQWIKQQLTVELRRAAPGSSRQKQALGLVEALERMPNPIESVGVLVTVLEQPRLGRGFEARVREALQRMTAQSHEAVADWRKWYEEAKNRSLAEWRLEVARRRDDRLKRYETEAEKYFNRLLDAKKADKDALLAELQAALTEPDTVFAVRRAAIRELGTLGRRGDERAVALLRARLGQAGSTDYDETKALVIEALGETGNRALLDDVAQYLARGYHLRMRTAAAGAIGALQEARGLEPLLAVLREAGGAQSPPDDLIEVVVRSIGRLKANPEGKASRALLDFVQTLRAGSNGGGAGSTTMAAHLANVAEALGQLRYAASAEDTCRVTLLLQELAAHEEQNVRFFATSALGTMTECAPEHPTQHPQPFAVLQRRLSEESATHVRRAILDALGQQGLNNPQLVEQAIKLLAPFLDDPEDALRRRARGRLEELATRPVGFRDNFAGLAMLVAVLTDPPPGGLGRPFTQVVPFLVGDNGLPAPDALNQNQLANKERYYDLLRKRALGQLETDPQAALGDFDAVIRGRNLGEPVTKEARGLRVGKARAMLKLTQPQAKEALSLLSACFASQDVDAVEKAELWNVTLDAADKLRQLEPTSVPAALSPLQQHLATAPADAQRRYGELVGGAPR